MRVQRAHSHVRDGRGGLVGHEVVLHGGTQEKGVRIVAEGVAMRPNGVEAHFPVVGQVLPIVEGEEGGVHVHVIRVTFNQAAATDNSLRP